VEGNEFIQVCPPVRSLGLGQIMGFHGWSLRGQRGRKDPAGRNDLSMAGYLPYGDFFITQDGPQKQALSWVVSEAQISCRVLSLDELQSSVTGQPFRAPGRWHNRPLQLRSGQAPAPFFRSTRSVEHRINRYPRSCVFIEDGKWKATDQGASVCLVYRRVHLVLTADAFKTRIDGA
jgi:hypothetical protein